MIRIPVLPPPLVGRRPGASARGPRAGQSGQGLLEFALVLPIFLFAFFGLIDGARLVYLNSTLSQAAREGARTGSVQASWIGSLDPACGTSGGPTCPADFNTFRDNVVVAVNRMMTPFGNITSADLHISCDAATPPSGAWTGQSCTTRLPGSVVTIRVVSAFGAVTPVLGQLLGTVTLTGSATMAVN